MKKLPKIFSLLMTACITLGCLAACRPASPGDTQPSNVDYAASIKLDMSSETVKQEVTVKTYVDGDTVHFNVPADFDGPEEIKATHVLKARFLAVDTPESTGKIEEYGKAASAFTKEKLSSATSIIVESDTGTWNADSTGSRFMVWIWYKTADSAEYRNLNLELLQNGLAIASNSAQNRYGGTCMKAIEQARAQKLKIYSGQKDPDYYYGEAVELTMKELRANIASYNGIKVAFTGVVTQSYNNSIYVEQYDAETDMYYGISVYYGFNQNGDALRIMSLGNEIRVVGKVSYYETGDTYQIVDVSYRPMKPDDPNNLQQISTGHSPAYVPVAADTFVNKKVNVLVIDAETKEEVLRSFSYAEMAMNTSVEMKNLLVKSVYTTDSDGSSDGAMTLTCEVDGIEIAVRTVVLRDAAGNLITAEAYQGKTIDVKGLVDYFDGDYQIKVFSADAITVH